MDKKKLYEIIESLGVEWDTTTGCCSFNKTPVITLWLFSTYRGLMESMRQMVGVKRLNLALQKEGRKSVEDARKIFAQYDTIEEGMQQYSKLLALAGWGILELISVDRQNKRIVFRHHNSAEGRYQKETGVCYGSGLLAGKVAGWGEIILDVPCWSDQTKFIAKGDQYDEFVVYPSDKTIENELHNLLQTNEATRADMAVAIQRLNNEIIFRKQTEQERDRFFNAINQTDESIVICDVKGDIVFVNPAFETITGYSSAEVMGKNPRILQSGEHDKEFYKKMWKTLLQKKTWKGEFINKKKDGTLFLEQVSISPATNEAGEIINYIAVKDNITEQRELEEQYRHAQKMETIGRLAGGVAHDYNNMLSVILGTAQMILMRDELSEKTIASLEQIQKAAQHSSEITNQLLAFSRKQVINPKVINVNHVVKDTIQMLGRLLLEGIEILFSPASNTKNIKIDPGQLHQIITNLCVNSGDALPEGGKLTLTIQNTAFAEDYCQGHTAFVPGNFVMLTISDNGTGIPQSILPHIFEPFFTTKEEGKGTGLGLASVYGAVKHNNGFINVESVQGQGTTFTLFFPVCEAKNDSLKRVKEDAEKTRSITLLLVENESMVREVTKKMLEVLGHKVLVAAGSKEALALFNQHKNELDLLLTDVVMPGMSGRQLQEKIERIRPDLPTLYMSGHTESVIENHGILKTGIHFLQKPFSLADLNQKIGEAIDQ